MKRAWLVKKYFSDDPPGSKAWEIRFEEPAPPERGRRFECVVPIVYAELPPADRYDNLPEVDR
jgi:hypothetical protein